MEEGWGGVRIVTDSAKCVFGLGKRMRYRNWDNPNGLFNGISAIHANNASIDTIYSSLNSILLLLGELSNFKGPSRGVLCPPAVN